MKTTIKTFKISLMLIAFIAVGCSEDDTTKIEDVVEDVAEDENVEEVEEEEEEEEEASEYVVSLRIQVDEETTADYFLTTDDLMSGEITAAGQGVELNGWNYTASYGGSYFALSYSQNECSAFSLVDSELTDQGKFVFERMDMLAPIDDDTFLAIGAPWGGGSYDCQLQLVDINNVAISKTVVHPIYESFDDEGVQLNAWPTAAYVTGDKLYVSFYTIYGDTWATPHTDKAQISVFSYPELEYLSTFEDDRTSPVGYYATQPSILEDESGNHFTLSPSSVMAGYTQMTKPSGILKINAGEQEFDADYFFNIEELGYKVLSGAYVGNGLVVAKVTNVQYEIADNLWGAFSSNIPVANAAIIDLNAKTFKILEDVPVHGAQYKTPYYLEDGKVYFSVNTGTEANIYQVDAATETVVKGASIIGMEVSGIYLAK